MLYALRWGGDGMMVNDDLLHDDSACPLIHACRSKSGESRAKASTYLYSGTDLKSSGARTSEFRRSIHSLGIMCAVIRGDRLGCTPYTVRREDIRIVTFSTASSSCLDDEGNTRCYALRWL